MANPVLGHYRLTGLLCKDVQFKRHFMLCVFRKLFIGPLCCSRSTPLTETAAWFQHLDLK